MSVAAQNSKCDASIADLRRGWSESWNVTCTIEGIVGGEVGFDRGGPTLTEVGSTDGTNPLLYHKVFFLVATASGKSIAQLPAGTVELRNLTGDGGLTYLATMEELQVLGGFTVTWLKASWPGRDARTKSYGRPFHPAITHCLTGNRSPPPSIGGGDTIQAGHHRV